MMVHHFLCTIKAQGAKEEGKNKRSFEKKRRALVQNREDFGWWASSLKDLDRDPYSRADL